ncbi:MAG TPA: hypothetical protein VK911_03580 [Vicinamibacterales bacterium]|nr:hypothetical protein [Vicinamibacterales bacterium]
MSRRLPIGAPAPMAARPTWFRAVVRASDRVTCFSPRTGLWLAGTAGAFCHAAGFYGPAATRITDAFPSLPPRQASRAARSLTRQDVCCRALDRLLQSDPSGLRASALLSPPHLERFAARVGDHAGVILLEVHSGPTVGTSLALQRMGRAALVIRMSQRGTCLPGFEVASLEGDEQRRAQALRRGVDWLRAGRPVIIAADSRTGTLTEPVPCLGCLVRFRRGAFVLARVAPAPIVPLFFRWGGGGSRIEMDAGPRIHPPTFGTAVERETAMAMVVAGWLDERLRSRPTDLSLALLDWLRGDR